MSAPNFVRNAGLILLVAGILAVVGFAIHPPEENAQTILESNWTYAHALGWIAFSLSVLGWMGVHEIMSKK